MNRACFLLVGCLTCSFGPTAVAPGWADTAPVRERFRVTVDPVRSKVRLGEPFRAKLRVENVTTRPQQFHVMSCSGNAHWRANTGLIAIPGQECDKNIPVAETIAPGRAYACELDLTIVAPGVAGGRCVFRLGFTPVEGPRTYWSDEVRVEVIF